MMSDDKHIHFSQPTKGTEWHFLRSISIWINKAGAINRRLCGSQIIDVFRVPSLDVALAIIERFRGFYDRPKDASRYNYTPVDLAEETAAFTVIVRELIPKSTYFPKRLEAILHNKQMAMVTFIPIDQDRRFKPAHEPRYQFAWMRHAEGGEIHLQCDIGDSTARRQQIRASWLGTVLLNKLVAWSEVGNISLVSTLSLVAADEYRDTYAHLKKEYITENWVKQSRSKKSIYEDIAIAAYLLLLWAQETKERNLQQKQSFIHLGCETGLLVYILTKEGYKGCGLNSRKRKNWDAYPDIDLKVGVMSPSELRSHPASDWIIGNGCNELIPWIPVVAGAACGTSFFVRLCPKYYNFDCRFFSGTKGTRYKSYIDYVRQIAVNCGFLPETDALKIASTRRLCIVGRNRVCAPGSETDIRRQEFISSTWAAASQDNWGLASDAQQRVKSARSNGRHANSDQIKSEIVKRVLELILTAPDADNIQTCEGKIWTKGGSVSLSAAMTLFDGAIKQWLKGVRGGLKTILRERHVFTVTRGRVQLHDFIVAKRTGRSRKSMKDPSTTRKTALCWFYVNHPDGCPQTSEMCQFAHGAGELR